MLKSTSEAEVLDAMENCIADVCSWMINDKLMLNDDKTEFLVIGTSKQLSKVSVSSIRVESPISIPWQASTILGVTRSSSLFSLLFLDWPSQHYSW